MRQETPKVTDELMLVAKQEFLSNGFFNASLRKIASNCGVSTNSIYTRFKDKEGLFDSIVKECADGLMNIYMDSTNKARHAISSNEVMNIGSDGTNDVLDYIYKHFDEFKLIFCCSNGTKYENYFDELAKIEEEFYKEFTEKFSKRKIDDFFIHVICRNGWQFVYEIISHNKTYEEAIKYMEDVKIFNFSGWIKLLEIE